MDESSTTPLGDSGPGQGDKTPTTADAGAERLSETDQEMVPRLDETPRGRRVLSAFLLVTLMAIGISTMPLSAIRDAALPVAQPYLLATGLDQRWSVFAPNPRQDTSYVEARVEYADGSVTGWTVPTANGVAEYWNYRWHKYTEQLWSDPGRVDERRAFARWVAEQHRADGREPVRVVLLRRTAASLPPGSGPDEGQWREEPVAVVAVDKR